MSVGYPDWAGTRLLHGTAQVLNVEHDAVAPGATVVDMVPINRPGYIVELHAWNADDTVTSLPFSVLMRWIDAVSGDGLDAQLWNMFAGTAAGPHFIDGSGPTKGGMLQLSVTNYSANTKHLSYRIIIDETSFAYTRHDWRTDDVFSFSIPGHSPMTNFDANLGLMGSVVNFNVAAGITDHFVLPLYNGPVQLHADTTGAAASTEVFLTMGAAEGGESGTTLFDQIVPTTGLDTWFYVPRCETILVIQNLGASSVTVDVTAIMGER